MLDWLHFRAMESPEPTPGPSRRVGVVLLDSFPPEGWTPLARLLARLAGAGVEAPPILRVVVGPPAGDVRERGSARDLELGSRGKTGLDLAAAARELHSRAGAELVVVAGSAPTPERLKRIDAYALAAALELGAIVGEIELSRLSGRPRLSPALFLLPLGVLEQLEQPPVRGLDALRPEWRALRRRSAPLDVKTPFGAWTRHHPLPVVDLRVVRRLKENQVGLASIDAWGRLALVGLPGLSATIAPRIGREHWVDEARVAGEVLHGELAEVHLRGWVVGDPRPDWVEVVGAGRQLARGLVNVHRQDVLAARPELASGDCGFDVRAAVGPFPPGSLEITWRAEGGAPTGRLGELRVLPVHRITLDRVLVPPRPPGDDGRWVRVEGRVESSASGVEVEAEIDGRALPVECLGDGRSADPSRPAQVPFAVTAYLPELRDTETARLGVRSRDAAGLGDRLERDLALATDAELGLPLLLTRQEVGDRDPVTGRTPIVLEGTVFGLDAGSGLGLRCGGRDLVEATVTPLVGGGPGAASFALARGAVALPPGEHRLELVRRQGTGGESGVASWTVTVEALTARVVDPRPSATPPEREGGPWRLVLEGGLEGGERIESLALEVDGGVALRLGAEWLRRDETGSAREAPRCRRFRFDGWLPLATGRRELRLLARRGEVEVPVWRGTLEVAVAHGETPPAVGIACPELDRLLREDPAPVWSRLVLDGRVVGALGGAVVRLRLEGADPVECRSGDDGGFRIVVDPGESGPIAGRVEVESDGRLVAQPPPFRIAPRRLRVAPDAVAALERLLAALVPGRAEGSGFSAADLLAALQTREVGWIGAQNRTLRRLARRLEASADRPGEVVREASAREEDGRRLRVLFVAWEPPCSLHGGGVAIRNLLRGLGERHEITLIHTAAPGEEGLSEEIRPWVREILPVRREWHDASVDLAFGVPTAYSRSYSPRFREVIEGELATGRYDLFNGDFLRTAHHVDVSDFPSVGVAHEIESFAAAATVPRRFGTPEAGAAWLGGFLRALDFEALFAPSRCTEFVTLTAPEAEFLAPLLPGRRIHVSPIPTDTERFAEVARRRSPSSPPSLLFVGNFIHGPNRAAANLLVERIAPAVRAQRPDVRFVLAGANAPRELAERGGRDGIEVPGFVPDLSDLVARATMFLAPLFEGAGMRVKLLEAMAAGCPVVSTSVGLSGIGGESGRTWLRSDSIDGFVEAILRLLDDPRLARELSEQGRLFVERSYGIAAQARIREQIWRAALAAFPVSGSR